MKLGATATKCSPFVQNLMAAALKKIAREKKTSVVAWSPVAVSSFNRQYVEKSHTMGEKKRIINDSAELSEKKETSRSSLLLSFPEQWQQRRGRHVHKS